jgi:hypothetical protein
MMIHYLLVTGITTVGLLLVAGLLHLIPKLGSAGRSLSDSLCRAPGLDILITWFTVLPLIAGPIAAGWIGFLAGLSGQIATLLIWTLIQEIVHPEARKAPRIISIINRKIGTFSNIVSLAATATVVPLFWVVRMAEIFIYPALVRFAGLPRYDQGEWVNVSRHKFEGLVGHDLIWCLYCDWMTGIWSLGTEILRNVESFWCPIRFHSEKKCANCQVDFPDIANGWVPASGNMADVVATIERHYPDDVKVHGWFGHPVRLTINGQPIPQPAAATVAAK